MHPCQRDKCLTEPGRIGRSAHPAQYNKFKASAIVLTNTPQRIWPEVSPHPRHRTQALTSPRCNGNTSGNEPEVSSEEMGKIGSNFIASRSRRKAQSPPRASMAKANAASWLDSAKLPTWETAGKSGTLPELVTTRRKRGMRENDTVLNSLSPLFF